MQDRPDLRELLEAVGTFLRGEVLPGLEGRGRYHMLVALNLLAIAGREWVLTPGQQAGESEALRVLLGGSTTGAGELRSAGNESESLRALNERLCQAIRAGDFDAGAGRARLLEHLREVTAGKLRIANPDFLERVARYGERP